MLLSFSSSAMAMTDRVRMDYEQRLSRQPELAVRMTVPDSLSDDEREALTFLYAYMPTSDVVDYDTEFFVENVRESLLARREMPWGANVPEREWLHFVLPVRVNNENLDDSRRIFYKELAPRVSNLPMADAILEINHWCHEKVTYQPSDARTSSPLATVANALGRCGEESTFTVAALRAMGIPARQVYTPRWAHTDDNHAWVEAWADGRWYFLGACEPEAVLNLAWFNAPASRGMLMNTNVAGAYDGPEEQLASTQVSTTINVTANYAPVDTTTVIVTDTAGRPVKDARVRFSLYNYAEFYPLAEKITDSLGRASFTSGRGDMLVWASDGSRFNLVSVKAGDESHITLAKDSTFTGVIDFNLVPPVSGGAIPEVSREAASLNDRRKAYEDSVRLAYSATFLSPAQATEISSQLGQGEDASSLLVKSRGNHTVIEKFLRDTPSALRSRAVALLGALAEKDLHDVTPDVLDDHLYGTVRGDTASPLWVPYVLNPRVENEMLRPYRRAILSLLTPEQQTLYAAAPQQLAADLYNSVKPDTLFNPSGYRQSATSTLTYHTSTPLNLSIAFVAVCRTLGVPACIDPVSHSTRWADREGRWHDVTFGPTAASDEVSGAVLQLVDSGDLDGRAPKYYTNFSLSRIDDGMARLMEFDDFETVAHINGRRQMLAPGQYLLVTGQRLADGAVLARSRFFTVEPGSTEVNVPLSIRQDTTALQVIGGLDAEMLYTPVTFTDGQFSAGDPVSILSTTGRGYYALGLIRSGHEPSAHALNDISAASSELALAGRPVLLLFSDVENAMNFRPSEYGHLPGQVVMGVDSDGKISRALAEGLEVGSLDYPAFVVADTFNRIVFARQGYSIHLGETLARILDQVK